MLAGWVAGFIIERGYSRRRGLERVVFLVFFLFVEFRVFDYVEILGEVGFAAFGFFGRLDCVVVI